MEEASRVVVLQDFHLASRKAEEAALRRFQAAAWLESFVGPIGISQQPSEQEFVSCLRNGILLCNAINKIQPGAVPKVIEGHSASQVPETQALPAFQYFENVRNFLVAVEELNLPAFEASDLDRDSMEAASTAKIVDCILDLKSYHEWKQWSGGVNGFNKHARSPMVPRVNGGVYSRVELLNSLKTPKRLDLTYVSDKLQHGEAENRKLEESIVRALVECLLDAKENIDHGSIASFLHGNMDTAEFFSKIMSSCLQEPLLNQFPELKLILEEYLAERNKSASTSMKGPLSTTLDKQSVTTLRRESCNHWHLLEEQEKDLLDLKALLARTKNEFEVLQSQLQCDIKELGRVVEEFSIASVGYKRVLKENRDLHNMVQDLKGNIRVYCRVRPIINSEVRNTIDFIGDDGSLVVVDPLKPGKESRKIFHFNQVFGPTATQEEIFKDTQPLIRSVMDGYNVCIFAYGQTGSGKTYTMCGPSGVSTKDLGINYMALNDLFHISYSRKDVMNYMVQVQMIEVYNEQVRDLLTEDSSTAKLEIRNCTNNGDSTLPDARACVVNSTMDVLNLMKLGEMNRAASSTAMNNQSSRSHSVLTVHVEGKDTSGNITRSCLHLVDLAGSERVDKSEVTGDRLKEAQYINKSLSCLGDVIAALAQKNSHIPYRNSKLTQILQSSLGGHAKTLMIAHVSPEANSYGETISTLKFAQRVSTVELGAARLNKESSEIKELREQVERLKTALARKEAQSVQLNKTNQLRSPRQSENGLPEYTPPRLRRLSIESSLSAKTDKSSYQDNSRNGAKTLGLKSKQRSDCSVTRPRRLSLEGSKYGKKDHPTIKTSTSVCVNGIHEIEAQQCVDTYPSQCIQTNASSDHSRSQNAEAADVSSRNYNGANSLIMGRTRIQPTQSPKTPEPTLLSKREVRALSPTDLGSTIRSHIPSFSGSTSKHGSKIRKSLQTIGKLINPSEKRNNHHSSSVVVSRSQIHETSALNDGSSQFTANARTIRRQSLTGGVQSSGLSRRASLGGKSTESYSHEKVRSKTPPPLAPQVSKIAKPWV